MLLKLVYANDIRRVTLRLEQPELTLSALEEHARRFFGAAFPGNAQLRFKYVDDEEDLITVTTPAELREATRLAARSGCLRVHVFVQASTNEPAVPLTDDDEDYVMVDPQDEADDFVHVPQEDDGALPDTYAADDVCTTHAQPAAVTPLAQLAEVATVGAPAVAAAPASAAPATAAGAAGAAAAVSIPSVAASLSTASSAGVRQKRSYVDVAPSNPPHFKASSSGAYVVEALTDGAYAAPAPAPVPHVSTGMTSKQYVSVDPLDVDDVLSLIRGVRAPSPAVFMGSALEEEDARHYGRDIPADVPYAYTY